MKKNIFYIIIIALYSIILSPSGAALYSIPTIQLADQNKYNLAGNSEYYEDKEGALTIEEITSPAYKTLFQPVKREVPHFGVSSSTYWLRFNVENLSQVESWIFDVNFHGLKSVEIYIDADKKFQWIETVGLAFPFEQRKIKVTSLAFPIELQTGITRNFYLRITSDLSFKLPISLHTEENFWNKVTTETFFFGVYFGIVLIMLLYNAFLYFFIRDRVYAYYTLYILCNYLFLYTFISGHIFLVFSFGSFYMLNLVFQQTWTLGLIFAIFFTRSFLHTALKHPVIDKLLFFLSSVMVVSLILNPFLDTTTSLKINLVYSLVTRTFLFVISLIAWMRKNKSARFFLIAWTAIIVAIIIADLRVMALIPSNFFTEYFMFFASALDLLLFTIALGDRIQILTIEKDTAQKDLISQRTRIAREIHDAAGSELTEMIVYLESIGKKSKTASKIYGRLKILIQKIRDMVFLLNKTENFSAVIDMEIKLYINRLSELRKLTLRYRLEQIGGNLTSDQALHLFRIFQEWMSNVLRHGKPSQIEIRIQKKGRYLYFTVYNDGTSFSWNESRGLGGMGLKNIEERSILLGSRFRIFSDKQKGTLFILQKQIIKKLSHKTIKHG
ncbi:MAG: 7TM diverse intracellular signaling domain-containing protein [Leptospirales bacterium]